MPSYQNPNARTDASQDKEKHEKQQVLDGLLKRKSFAQKDQPAAPMTTLQDDTKSGSQSPEDKNLKKADIQNSKPVLMRKETLDELVRSESEAKSKRSRKAAPEVQEKPEARDKYGMSDVMRELVNRKYEILNVVGKGSYGCVTKARCKRTGREVALKVMIQKSQTEYEMIKLLREI